MGTSTTSDADMNTRGKRSEEEEAEVKVESRREKKILENMKITRRYRKGPTVKIYIFTEYIPLIKRN